MGAHTPSTDGAATKALHLAEFALTALQAHCAGNNAIACGWLQGASVSEVVRASTQVVAGTNYAIQVRTSKGHTLHLTVFEQAWTQTFELTVPDSVRAGEYWLLSTDENMNPSGCIPQIGRAHV